MLPEVGMRRTVTLAAALAVLIVLAPLAAGAAEAVPGVDGEGTAPHLHGADLGLIWGIPFAGILLSIALAPLLAPASWHHHDGKVSAFWIVALLLPFGALLAGDVLAFIRVFDDRQIEINPLVEGADDERQFLRRAAPLLDHQPQHVAAQPGRFLRIVGVDRGRGCGPTGRRAD